MPIRAPRSKTTNVDSPVDCPASAAIGQTAIVVSVANATLRWQYRRMHSIVDEYRTVADGAVWFNRTSRGRLRLEGSDRVSFLQALVSNDVSSVAAGAGVYATYLTPQGRMLADLRIYDRGDWLLVETTADLAPALAQKLDSLVFSEDVRIADITQETAQILVVGSRAARVLEPAVDVAAAELEALPILGHRTTEALFIVRTDDALVPAYEIVLPKDGRDALVQRLESSGAVAGSHDLLETLRIEAARPLFGVDMNNETIPLEAGLLDRAISTTKGCYVGQEIIIRVLHRGGGRVARRLVQITLDDPSDACSEAGAEIVINDKEVGRLTSVAYSPRVGRCIALGYVPRAAAEPGTRVMLRFGTRALPASVTALAG